MLAGLDADQTGEELERLLQMLTMRARATGGQLGPAMHLRDMLAALGGPDHAPGT